MHKFKTVSIADIENTAVAYSCWIIGTGPSLDDIVVSQLVDRDIIAINGAIMAFQGAYKMRNLTWLFRDLTAYRKVVPFVDKWPHRILTRGRNVPNVTADKCDVFYFSEDDPRAYCKATSATCAVRLASHMGYKRCYLVGCDCAKHADGRIHARGLHHFSTTTEDLIDMRFETWIEDWRLLELERLPTHVVRCFKSEVLKQFTYLPFKTAIKEHNK